MVTCAGWALQQPAGRCQVQKNRHCHYALDQSAKVKQSMRGSHAKLMFRASVMLVCFYYDADSLRCRIGDCLQVRALLPWAAQHIDIPLGRVPWSLLSRSSLVCISSFGFNAYIASMIPFLSTFVLVLLSCPLIFAYPDPRPLTWSTKAYGPDGLRQAVQVQFGTPGQPLDAYPGGVWESLLVAPNICTYPVYLPGVGVNMLRSTGRRVRSGEVLDGIPVELPAHCERDILRHTTVNRRRDVLIRHAYGVRDGPDPELRITQSHYAARHARIPDSP